MRILTIKTSTNILINFFNYIRLVIFLLCCIFDLLIYKILKHKIIIIYTKNFIFCCCVFRDIDCKILI